jgi:hypothetical protein
MPFAEQQRLSETARYYNDCFDVEGLHAVCELYNQTICQVAKQEDVPLIDLEMMIPGGDEFFADATHFSPAGETLAAEILHRYITKNGYVAKLYQPDLD